MKFHTESRASFEFFFIGLIFNQSNGSNIHTLSLSVAVILMTASPNGCNSETDLEYGVPIYPGGLTLRLTVISTLDVPFIVGAALSYAITLS